MKNSKKNVATNKKAYQAALIKKATAKKTNATPAVDSVNTDNISTTTDTAPVRKVNDKALQDALAYLLSNYPAIETTRKSDFKDVFNMLLKLNVDLSSKKDISAETERILNILGFTNNKHNVTKEFISKYDIPQLVTFMFEGLLAAHQYFIKDNPTENRIRGMINNLWRQAEWNFFTQGQDVMYWHWSPYNGWAMNHQIKGHNECHIIYILGASSPTYPIAESVYHKGWVNANTFLNGREYYGIRLPLGNDNGKGGPLFFTHYSYMGLDPHGLKDRYADYEEQMKAHTLINRAYCIDNPKGYKGYGEKCWGLTASDGDKGYSAHSPGNDRGVITPTAALSSIPYTPEYSLEAMRYFYEELGDRLWGEYGFKDAFNLTEDWFAPSYLAIDQGPIIVMIENYRTGLIWKLFMSHPDVQKGLKRLGFTSPYLNKAD